MVNNQCYNPYNFGKISKRSFRKCVGCIALIVYRFRDNRQKHQHRRLNSYRGDYNKYLSIFRQDRIFFFWPKMLRWESKGQSEGNTYIVVAERFHEDPKD